MSALTEFSKTCSLKMPNGFPSQDYDNVYDLLRLAGIAGRKLDKYMDGFLPAQLTSSWISVAYKFRAVYESNEEYIKVSEPFQYSFSMMDGEALYAQERALFNFFVNGLSMVESLFYCLHFIGALMEPGIFAYDSNNDKLQRKINPERVQVLFKQYCEKDRSLEATALYLEMKKIGSSESYEELSKIRNQVSHRVSPPIRKAWAIAGSGVPDGVPTHGVTWFDTIALDMNTTTVRFEWLTQILDSMVVVVQKFLLSKP